MCFTSTTKCDTMSMNLMKGLMLMSPKEKKYTERIVVFFTKEQLEQVRAEAERLGLDVSAYVRMVVMKEVNRDA